MNPFETLVSLMTSLRDPKRGCPWDREQTHSSLTRYAIEETYELIDAIASGDDREMIGELGDLLLQVVFHSEIARGENRFTILDVIQTLNEKLIRRHLHVFGNAQAETISEVLHHWERIKTQERASNPKPKGGTLDGIPGSLPPLTRAHLYSDRACRAGFDWDSPQAVRRQMEQEMDELFNGENVEEEVGDLFFTLINLARKFGVDPDAAIAKAATKFKRRFDRMEAEATRRYGSISAAPRAELETVWQEAKRSTSSHKPAPTAEPEQKK